jgi:hypothetical protein
VFHPIKLRAMFKNVFETLSTSFPIEIRHRKKVLKKGKKLAPKIPNLNSVAALDRLDAI